MIKYFYSINKNFSIEDKDVYLFLLKISNIIYNKVQYIFNEKEKILMKQINYNFFIPSISNYLRYYLMFLSEKNIIFDK